MANVRNTLNKLIKLLDDLEDDLFEDKSSKSMIYNGEIYTRVDWNNCKQAIRVVQKAYKSWNNSISNYMKEHKDYNRVKRMLHYYGKKRIKKPKDFERIEQLNKQLNDILINRENEKLNKYKSISEKCENKINDFKKYDRGDENW